MHMDYEKKLYNEIGKNIQKKRKELGITQEKFSDITNYSLSFIANIESNTYQSFSIIALHNIAKALNTTMCELLPKESLLNNKHNNIKCGYCDYQMEIPIEIQELLTDIESIFHQKINLTCPKCQKKIM